MFSIDQIAAAHSKVRSGADFPQYIQDLTLLGVTGYVTYVADGHTDYQGSNHFSISSSAKYETLEVAETSDATTFEQELRGHQQGKTSYPAFCKACAAAGVEKWAVSVNGLTCTYYDKAGNKLLEEKIPG